ncbi:integrase [Pseudorhodobacter sp. E13]|uniref:tyrosine-type recombinase/integrase n=1 Tax=Pseudorhodobacter sp. E13 TaxID=2487931 RepID=UPI000F8DE443|nr:tyrosine-type recombinase/integrase [Pseudorhodobacter sp. E13]RUS63644.1 integrase [Pseudorhodobacter sp. E13]
MRSIRSQKKQAWNRGHIVGQKRAFSAEELAQIEAKLVVATNWHDLALLSFALDTMLRASDLLATQVWQVRNSTGPVRTMIARRQRKTQTIVQPVLTPATRYYLERWISVSGKQPAHYLFTRSKPTDAPPISRPHYAEIIKNWARELGHDPSEFSSHSIRRSKPAHMYWAGEDIALISRLLGHKSIGNTVEYLGITQAKAEVAALRHSLMRGFGEKPL